ncbi:MAG: universal stress protein [Polyangiaceae bacterium]|nr:universal stress protein [Polyangiaceae bacterium]
MQLRRLLVPVDYSEHAERVLAHAAELAAAVGAEVHALHVWECMPNAPASLLVQTPEGPRKLGDLVRETAERDMIEFLAKVTLPEGVRVTHALASGEPTKALLEAAARADVDLIVMGTHGRTGLKHAVLGSVAEKLVRLSPKPVLVVPLRA